MLQIRTGVRGYLGRRGYRGTRRLRACKALDFAVSDLDPEVLRDAGPAVNVLTLFKEHAAGAQLLGEANPTAEDLTVENLLPLSFVKVQELTQQISVQLRLQNCAGVQLCRLLPLRPCVLGSLGGSISSAALQLRIFAAATGDLQRRLQTHEFQSLFLEELNPGEEHHAALILLPQVIQTFTQRCQLINR